MSNSMLSNQRLTLKSHIPISFGVWDTFKIFETGLDVVEGSIVFSNKVQLERLVVNIDTDWTCEIVMRWLDNTEIKNEDPSLKRDWDIWANGYITVFASDIFDKDSELPQTIKAPFIFEKEVTFKDAVNFDEWFDITWPVKPFPQVDDETERDNMYPNPTWWEVAIVWGYLQIFNPETQQRETLDVGTPLPDATETVKGKIRIATEEEALAWSNDTVAMTPKKVKELTTTEIEANEASLTDDTFMLWEDCTKWDSLFKEVWPTFADADQVQAIGNTAANTRVSIPAFGGGIASNAITLSLRKYVSPSVDLCIRIETDNAGEPSGTLFDANATATVTSASLTTSLVETTVTLAWNITIPKGQKVHVVLYPWTYGSETINGTNYFGVGYKPQDTTTRRAKTYDGADWSEGQATRFYYVTQRTVSDTGSPVSDTSNISLNYSNNYTDATWYRIQASKNIKILSVTKNAKSTATRAILKTDWGVTIQTASFSGNVATFATPYLVLDWEFVRIECDNSGGSYASRYRDSPTYPQARTNIIYNTGSYEWANSARGYSIDSITTQEQTIVYSEDLFSNKLLSKTDARYSYKLPNDIPRFAKTNWTIGERVKCGFKGITDWFTGLEEWKDYFLQNTPWAIWLTAGTNTYWIWKAINSTKLFIKDILSGSI